MTDAMPFSEADRREYLVREAQLQRLETLIENVHQHAANVKIGLSVNWDSLLIEEDYDENPVFMLTTETEIPVMILGRDAGKQMKSDLTYSQAENFIGGLTFGLMFGGNWSE